MCSLYVTYSYYLSSFNIYFNCAPASSNSSYATEYASEAAPAYKTSSSIKTALSLLQEAMGQVLNALYGLVCYISDIVVMGCTTDWSTLQISRQY